ncbi:CHAT domain-containing protein [Microbacterium halophytorum]|uniref:CHAT domain-containing protein n=1 Tax=Microbacterium halophytorum TaxID=2067568 RepID=UPI000CFAF5A5|nr:CHAT domain-containing protein [Microbacterium halophytorum]
MVTMSYPDAAEVVADVERPTAQLKYVDTADAGLWVTWRWEHAVDKPRIWGIRPQQLAGALAAFEQAIPDAQGAESVDDALRRSWAVWGDVEREKRVAYALAVALIPQALAAEVNGFLAAGRRPHLRIQSSRSLASVPWQALRVDEGLRMVHEVDVSTLLPASVRNAPRRRASAWDAAAPVVASVDPEVPGRIPGLGPVLRTDEPIVADALAHLGERLVGGQRHPVSREQLRERLGTAGRWLYVGHVTSGAFGLDTRLHLTDGPAACGRADLIAGVHRPLTAGDIVFGDPDEHARPDSGPWRVPNRVALIACASGSDASYGDPSGLVGALTMRGAEVVTAARWTLPTDVGLEWLAAAGLGPAATESSAPFHAFARAVAAVNAAHESDDPVAALSAWQRAEADAWERTGDPEHTPLIWASLTTSVAGLCRAKMPLTAPESENWSSSRHICAL